MMRFLMFYALLIPVFSFSQYAFSFDSASFEFLSGDTQDFETIESGWRLNASNSGLSEIYFPMNMEEGMTFECSVSLDYSPSSSNGIKWFLIGDSTVLNHSQNAFYLKIGESGSADSFDVYQRVNGTDQLLLEGEKIYPSGGDSIHLKLSILEESLTFFIEDSLQGTSSFNPMLSTGFSGWSLSYTSSNVDRTILHSLSVDITQQDLQGPFILQHEFTSPTILKMEFDEDIDSLMISSGFVDVQSFFSDNQTIYIEFNEDFQEDQEIEFWVDVWDSHRNHESFEMTTNYSSVQLFDLVFNEFMIDPTPSLSYLPEEEYIELKNTSNRTINLSNFTLVINDDSLVLESQIIPIDSFLVLNNFPSLSNSQFSAQLLNPFHQLVDFFHFDLQNYKDDSHVSGGWSLEKKEAKYKGKELSSWSYHHSFNGGSPGQENSNLESLYDDEAPYINWIERNDDYFVYHLNEYAITADSLSLTLVDLGNEVNDLEGNTMMDSTLSINSIQSISKGDLVISEILFKETTEIPEFIEIQNTTQNTLQIKDLFLVKKEGEAYLPIYQFPNNKLVLNDEIFTITSNKKKLLKAFPSNKFTMINDHDLPTFLSSEMTLALMTLDQEIIDEIHYHEKWNHPDYKYVKGLSLERVDLHKSGKDSSNWMTASSDVRGASPGLINSQKAKETDDFSIRLRYKMFREYQFSIDYSMEYQGNQISLFLFDLSGQFIGKIENDLLLDREGEINLGNNASLLNLAHGNYILMAQIDQLDGRQKRRKLGFVK